MAKHKVPMISNTNMVIRFAVEWIYPKTAPPQAGMSGMLSAMVFLWYVSHQLIIDFSH